MIREAVESDIPAIMEMGKRFADEAGVTDAIGWDGASVDAMLRTMIEGEHILLVGDRGMIGGLVFGHPFSGKMVFQELFWRNEGPATQGIRLLEMAERMAKERGCERSMMIEIGTFPGAAQIYERRGYRPAERNFIKEL